MTAPTTYRPEAHGMHPAPTTYLTETGTMRAAPATYSADAHGMRTPHLAYGGDFNPEQWDESYLEEDVRLMREAGVSVATLGVFSWSVLEPRPGQYELDWLRRVMDRLHEAGVGVDLATGTASPPPWLGAQHPDTLPVTRDGVRLWWGSRQQYNPGSAVLRERIRLLVERMAAEFAHHPALVAWHVSNEYACHVHESFDDESAARFRTWLQSRYGSLTELNAAWGTAFWSQRLSSWDEVIPPRTTPTIPNPHHLSDWRAFCSDNLLDLYLLERDILRAANPDVPITTNFMGLFGPLDYWRWAEEVDFVSNDSYPDPADPRAARVFAFEADLMRSLGRGKPFVQMEQVTSAVQWRSRNATKRPGQYGLWSLQAVAHGADGILNFQWRQSLAGAEAFHGAMVPHAGTSSRTWGEVAALGRQLGSLDQVRGSRVPADVAIVWDWANAWAQADAVGPVADAAPEAGARAWHASLFERGHVVDFVHPDDDLSAYRLVLVPSLFRLTPAHARRLREAVAAGTSVLVTYLSGYVDEHGHAVEGGYLGTVADVLGVRVVDVAPLAVVPDAPGRAEPIVPEIDRITTAVGAPAAEPDVPLVGADGAPWPGKGLGWAERVLVVDEAVEVLARFGGRDHDGEPAVAVRRTPGAGAAWYVATDLDARGRDHLLADLLTAAGVPVPAAAPSGVEVRERGGVVFLLNHGDESATVEGVRGTRLDTGETVDGGIVVAPRSAVLLGVAEQLPGR
ncbi:beta-galactosidase [Georgenia sp. TF02-10]|uniref:beta-galactosidase n=1 Tax=Georgenia sp. TF02-10 TaxID=2917725 RepID=UPI001FA75348|nr:beta-galactosidase [Georgenia sp. TF02-10]UNX56118.1 beta-galactosidase [Georgenia sp. TF02-10]